MSHRSAVNHTVVVALIVGILYLAVWVWFKLTGQKPEMES
jgi:hypothetical protein